MSFTLAVTVLLGDELRGLHLPGGSLLALGVAVGEVVERLPLTAAHSLTFSMAFRCSMTFILPWKSLSAVPAPKISLKHALTTSHWAR